MKLKPLVCCLITTLLLSLFGCATNSRFYAKSLRIAFLGDIMAHQAQLDAALQPDGSYNFWSVFAKIAPTLQSYDLVIANFETTLAGKPYSGYPSFSCPIALVSACQKAGINLLLLANNHILDQGEKGLVRTAQKLHALKIPYLGARTSTLESNSLIYKKSGLRIGLLNYTQLTNGNSHSPLVNYLHKETITKEIAALKKENPDKIIVCVHWGKEYRSTPDNYQQKMGRFLLEQGADIVVGSHPHTVQPYLWDKSQDRLIAYSLGNFVSNQRTSPRDGGMILAVTLAGSKTNKAQIKRVEPIPIWVEKYFDANQKAHYHILPAQDYARKPEYFRYKASYQQMQKFLSHYNQVIH